MRNKAWVFLRHPFVLFVAVGAATGVIHLAGFISLRTWLDPIPANAVALTVATLVNTEAHRALTFRDHRPCARWRLHLKAGITLAGSLLLAALLLASVPAQVRVWEVVAVLASDAITTIVRYLLLRLWVFPPVSKAMAQ